jgi:hypothetical protein
MRGGEGNNKKKWGVGRGTIKRNVAELYILLVNFTTVCYYVFTN